MDQLTFVWPVASFSVINAWQYLPNFEVGFYQTKV